MCKETRGYTGPFAQPLGVDALGYGTPLFVVGNSTTEALRQPQIVSFTYDLLFSTSVAPIMSKLNHDQKREFEEAHAFLEGVYLNAIETVDFGSMSDREQRAFSISIDLSDPVWQQWAVRTARDPEVEIDPAIMMDALQNNVPWVLHLLHEQRDREQGRGEGEQRLVS